MRVGELATKLDMHIDDLNSTLRDMKRNRQIVHEKRVIDGEERWVVIPRVSPTAPAGAFKQANLEETNADFDPPVLVPVSSGINGSMLQPDTESTTWIMLRLLETHRDGLTSGKLRELCGSEYGHQFLKNHISQGRVLVDKKVYPHKFSLPEGATAMSVWLAAQHARGKTSRFVKKPEETQPLQAFPADTKTDEPPPAAAESIMDKQVGGDHYKRKSIQPWDAMQAWQTHEQFVGFLHGNAIEYIARYASKGGIEDLRKAIHYLQKLIDTLEMAA